MSSSSARISHNPVSGIANISTYSARSVQCANVRSPWRERVGPRRERRRESPDQSNHGQREDRAAEDHVNREQVVAAERVVPTATAAPAHPGLGRALSAAPASATPGVHAEIRSRTASRIANTIAQCSDLVTSSVAVSTIAERSAWGVGHAANGTRRDSTSIVWPRDRRAPSHGRWGDLPAPAPARRRHRASSTPAPTSRRSSRGWPRARRTVPTLPRAIVVPHEHVAMCDGARLLLRDRASPGGRDPAHQRRARQRRDRRDQRRHRSRADDPDVGPHARRRSAGGSASRTVPIGWGQEMRDQAALVREACKWDYEVRFPEQVPELLDRAYAIATTHAEGARLSQPAARGAVRAVPGRRARRAAQRCAPASLAPRPTSSTAAAELLAGAERPLIIAQRGAGSQAGFDGARRHRRAVVDPGVPVVGGGDRDLRRASDVRRARTRRRGSPRRTWSSSSTASPRGCPTSHQPSGRLPCDPARAQPALQPVPGAQLPLRPVDHDRGRRRSRGARTARCAASVDAGRHAGAPAALGRRLQRRPPRAVACRVDVEPATPMTKAWVSRLRSATRSAAGARRSISELGCHARRARPHRARLVAAGAAFGRARLGPAVRARHEARRSRPARRGDDGRRLVHVRQPGRLPPRRRGARHRRAHRRPQQRRLRRGAANRCSASTPPATPPRPTTCR